MGPTNTDSAITARSSARLPHPRPLAPPPPSPHATRTRHTPGPPGNGLSSFPPIDHAALFLAPAPSFPDAAHSPLPIGSARRDFCDSCLGGPRHLVLTLIILALPSRHVSFTPLPLHPRPAQQSSRAQARIASPGRCRTSSSSSLKTYHYYLVLASSFQATTSQDGG